MPFTRGLAGRAPARRVLLAGCAGLLLAGCGGGSTPAASAPSPSPSLAAFHGIEPEPMPARPSFVLTTTEGERYDFAARTGGRPTLVYFGYTNCPDECPTALADISTALRATTPALREQVVVVFVTTDPARDTPQVLRRWLDGYSKDYLGLVGTQAEVDAAQQAAGVAPARRAGPIPTLPGRPNEHEHEQGAAAHEHAGPLGYGVGHANLIFAYDRNDRLPVLYPGGVRPADIAADLPRLAQGDPP